MSKQSDTDRIQQALDNIRDLGGFDGEHHKQWLLNELVKTLTGTEEAYEEWVTAYQKGEDGDNTYEWGTGIAP